MVKHVDKVTTKENDIGLQGLGRHFFQISCICNQFMKYEIILQLREGDEGRGLRPPGYIILYHVEP